MKGYCLICQNEIEVQMCCSGRDCGCMGLPIDPPICSDECYEIWDKQQRAFRALLEYELNCIVKYDYPDNRPSKPPIKSETMYAYSQKYGTTIEEMKKFEKQVEDEIKRQRKWKQ